MRRDDSRSGLSVVRPALGIGINVGRFVLGLVSAALNTKLKRGLNETAVSLTKRMRDGQCERVRVN
jgi:hypothetical protein